MIEHDEVSTAIDVRLDHTILPAIDAKASAEFFAEIFGLPVPVQVGHFHQVRFSDGRILDFAEPGIYFPGQHFACLVNEHTLDRKSTSELQSLMRISYAV